MCRSGMGSLSRPHHIAVPDDLALIGVCLTAKILALVDAAAPAAPADMGEILTVVKRATT